MTLRYINVRLTLTLILTATLTSRQISHAQIAWDLWKIVKSEKCQKSLFLSIASVTLETPTGKRFCWLCPHVAIFLECHLTDAGELCSREKRRISTKIRGAFALSIQSGHRCLMMMEFRSEIKCFSDVSLLVNKNMELFV